jgi:hypothetical protein
MINIIILSAFIQGRGLKEGKVAAFLESTPFIKANTSTGNN